MAYTTGLELQSLLELAFHARVTRMRRGSFPVSASLERSFQPMTLKD